MVSKTPRRMGTTSTGFTIVELLIVVVVIAILAAITIVAYNGISNRAKDSAVQSATSQAFKRVKAHAALNSDTPPATLAAVGITDSGGVNYQYSPSTDGFCITSTQGGRAAYMASNYVYNGGTVLNKESVATGACPGHATSGGTVIRNLITNPSFENGTTDWTIGGSASTLTSTGWSSAGAQSMRIINTTTGNSGDFRTANYSMTYIPYGMEPGKTYTVSARVQYSAAPTGGLNRAPGVLIWYSTNGTNWNEDFGPKPPTTPGTYTISHTISLPANTTGVIIGFGAASTTSNQSFYYDSVILTEGTTVYPFADGNSPNWVWTGAVNDSASTGPAL